MRKTLRYFIVLTVWMMAACPAFAQPAGDPLIAPEFNPLGTPVQETNITLDFYNPNTNSSTEIYRSLTSEGGYELIHTSLPGEESYHDTFLKPRTTFYYKLRAIRDSLTSEFSTVQAQTTYSQFFYPTLTATATSPTAIELSLHDLSYADLVYDIERREVGQPGAEYIWSLEASDSGGVHTFLDENVVPGTQYTYHINVTVLDEGMPSYFDIVQASAEPFTINPPAITGAPSVYYENNILFGIDNAYPESDTEIYRSLSSSGGFELIAVVPGSEIAYYDADLSPRTTYYYKLRANWSGVVSEYSGVASYITGSKYYPPYLTSAALSSTAVALTLTDRSYDDLYYEIIRTSGPGTWSRNITAADSGQVITVIDSTVSPGTTYQYRVDVYTKGPGNPNYPGAATTSVTTLEHEDLATPVFSYQAPPEFLCGSFVNFEFYNSNAGSQTEIYRSLTENEEDFVLIYTTADENESYFVDDVNPHTTYYYKLRAIRDGETSEFTEMRGFTSLSEFYNPTITAEAVNYGFESNWVELVLTDNSYADISYGIMRNEVGTDNWVDIGPRVELLDSGQNYYFTDETVKANTTYVYYVDAIINCDGLPQYYEVASDSVTTLEEYLLPPDFLPYPPSTYPCGNEIAFVIKNENQGSYTEVWRSRFPDTGFVLVDSIFSWSDSFLDTGLGSRKTYYYKLRAVKGTAVSEFSEVQSFQSGATFYNPILTTTLLPDNTIEIKLLDRSYLDTRYEILGDASPFVEGAVSSDSGVVHTFIDASVVPGGTYGYYVNVELLCDGLPMLFNVATDSITIPAVPEGPVVTGFTLVDPYTDQDIRVLHDYDTINATNRPTIRADASSDARSVRFFLNGKRISTSNTVPHSLYGDAKGNYNPGKLKPGDYTLTAIPYTKRNANGVEGTSLTIHFTVYKDEPQSALARDGQMETENQTRFFPNPLISQSVIEVASVPESKVKIQIMDHQGNVLTTMFNGKLDEEGILRKEVNRNQFVTGTYLLAVTINGKTTVTRFIVE